MARLPDDTAFGAVDARASGRPIATYDTSGYARGAAAMGEGAKDLGAGIMTAGKALGAYAAQKAAAEEKLQQARTNAELTAKELARTNAIERESDPVGLVARHADEAAKEFEQAAQRISDPQQRANLLLHRDGYVAGVTRAAKQQESVLSASSDMTRDWEAVDALSNDALDSKDPSAFNRTADVFNGLVDAWHGYGLIDDAKAVDIKRNWATDLAERALLKASPADRVQAIEAVTKPVVVDAANASADEAGQPAADPAAPQSYSDLTQLARMLPADVQTRMQYEAQSELERNAAQQTLRKAEQYEKSMTEASQGDPKRPPWRAAIQADPDLDDLTRARLLQQHDAMQRQLDAFWSAKVEYDKPNGRKFELNDAKDHDFVEQIYTRLGADTVALHAVVNRTGMMPQSAVARMNGDLASGDPTRIGRTVDQLARLSRAQPNLLLRQDGGEDLQYAATQFRYEMKHGATRDEAINRIIQLRSPEFQEAWAAQRKTIDIDAEVVRATSMFDLDRSFEGDPASMAAALMTYRDLVKNRYVATKDMSLAKAQALDLLKPVAQRANLMSREYVDDGSPSLAERFYLNHLASYYLGTLEGSGYVSLLADARKKVEAGTDPEELLKDFYPALLAGRPDQKGHRRAALEWLKNAPQEHKEILANLARYNAMKGFSSTAEAVVALGGQFSGNARALENLAVLPAKAATLGGRVFRGGLSQMLFSGGTDPLVQKMAIAGGAQEKYEPWQTVAATGLGAFVGGANAAWLGRRLVPEAPGEVTAPASHAPEGPWPGVKGETPVASKPEAQAPALQETPLNVPVDKEPAHAPAGISSQPGEVTRFDAFELGGDDPLVKKMIVQGSSDVHALREGALQRKPILENDLQRIAAGIDGAQFVSARVKDAPGLAEKVAAGRPAHTVGDFLGGRISVESPAALKAARDEVEKTYRTLEVDDKIAKPKKGGYRAVHMQVDLGNGMSAEIQLVPSEIAKVMDSTHQVYDQFKRLNLQTATAEERAAADAASAWIRSVHDKAWAEQERRGWRVLQKD